jgi:hypothetical protein
MKNRQATLVRAFAILAAALISSCGGSSYGGGDGDGPPPATLSISLDPTTITLGESATITWNSNAPNCNASGAWSGSKSGDGSETVTPSATGTFTYSLVCSGGQYSESEQGSVTLTVDPTRSAGLWVGDGCCVESQSFAVVGLTNDVGG